MSLEPDTRSEAGATRPPTAADAAPIGQPSVQPGRAPADAIAPVQGTPNGQRELWLEVALVLAVAVVPPLLNALVTFLEPEPTSTGSWHHGSPSDSVFLIGSSLPPIALILWLARREPEPETAFGLRQPSRLADLLWAPVLAVLGMAITAMVVLVVGLSTTESGRLARGVAQSAETTPLSLLLSVAGLATSGFAEELAIRGYLLTRLEQLTASTRRAVVWSSACFASYHVYQGIAGLVGAFGFGVVFGLAFVKMRRVWPLALAHWLYNLNLCYGPLFLRP